MSDSPALAFMLYHTAPSSFRSTLLKTFMCSQISCRSCYKTDSDSRGLGQSLRYYISNCGCWATFGVARFFTSRSQLGTILPPRGHLAMSGDIFDYHNWGWWCYWILYIEVRDVAKHSTTYRMPSLPTKSYPSQNVNSDSVEKLYFRGPKFI